MTRYERGLRDALEAFGKTPRNDWRALPEREKEAYIKSLSDNAARRRRRAQRYARLLKKALTK